MLEMILYNAQYHMTTIITKYTLSDEYCDKYTMMHKFDTTKVKEYMQAHKPTRIDDEMLLYFDTP